MIFLSLVRLTNLGDRKRLSFSITKETIKCDDVKFLDLSILDWDTADRHAVAIDFGFRVGALLPIAARFGAVAHAAYLALALGALLTGLQQCLAAVILVLLVAARAGCLLAWSRARVALLETMAIGTTALRTGSATAAATATSSRLASGA